MNRVPGVGPWARKPNGTVMVGFFYAPRGWLAENYDDIAVVNGKMEWVPPEEGSSKDYSNEDMTGIPGIY